VPLLARSRRRGALPLLSHSSGPSAAEPQPAGMVSCSLIGRRDTAVDPFRKRAEAFEPVRLSLTSTSNAFVQMLQQLASTGRFKRVGEVVKIAWLAWPGPLRSAIRTAPIRLFNFRHLVPPKYVLKASSSSSTISAAAQPPRVSP